MRSILDIRAHRVDDLLVLERDDGIDVKMHDERDFAGSSFIDSRSLTRHRWVIHALQGKASAFGLPPFFNPWKSFGGTLGGTGSAGEVLVGSQGAHAVPRGPHVGPQGPP